MSIWYILECSTVRDVGDMGDMGDVAAAAAEGASRSEWEDGGFLGGG